jgi:hypothetical protein
VKQRGEEIGEVGHGDRHLQLRLRHRRQVPAQIRIAVFGAERARERQAQGRPGARSLRHEAVENGRGARSRRCGGKAVEGGGRGGQIENLIADRDADAQRRRRGRAKDAEGEILNREFAIRDVGAVEETPPRRIVRLIERRHALPWRCSSRRR